MIFTRPMVPAELMTPEETAPPPSKPSPRVTLVMPPAREAPAVMLPLRSPGSVNAAVPPFAGSPIAGDDGDIAALEMARDVDHANRAGADDGAGLDARRAFDAPLDRDVADGKVAVEIAAVLAKAAGQRAGERDAPDLARGGDARGIEPRAGDAGGRADDVGAGERRDAVRAGDDAALRARAALEVAEELHRAEGAAL